MNAVKNRLATTFWKNTEKKRKKVPGFGGHIQWKKHTNKPNNNIIVIIIHVQFSIDDDDSELSEAFDFH